MAEIAQHAGRPDSKVVARLNSVRDAARWARPAVAVLGLALAIGAVVALCWFHRRDWRTILYLLAICGIAAGLVLLGAWVVIRVVVRAPLAPMTGSGPGTWNLPDGVRFLLADIQAELGRDLAVAVRRVALVPIIAGVVCAVVAFAAPTVRSLGRSRAVALSGAAAVIVAVFLVVVLSAGSGRPVKECNGHRELCDRRYDQVVYAATHNSMSSPDVVTIWPEHDADISTQLEDGVRALLIDTHYWTKLVSDEQLTAADPFLPPALAKAVFDHLGPLRNAHPGTFLCHNECALGGTPLLGALQEIRDFLDANPTEVVTLIIQDAITPRDTADAFHAAGLDPYLFAHRPGRTWPTLGTLIDRDQRLVVFAEDSGPPPDWYNQAFANIQETPYLFRDPAEFSCARNRGPADATLFLINHWVQRIAPDRVDAVKVNQHDVIVDRARECERERGHMANYIAVNFSNIGDLVRAVDTLNGVG